jgi:DNA-binding FrmR family transcriptional regulator
MDKAKAVKKAQDAVARLKEIETGQAEVVRLFQLADDSEGNLNKQEEAFKQSDEYKKARATGNATFRIACSYAVEALAEKIFTTQDELAVKLNYDKNKMSRIIKCGKVFIKFDSQALGKVKDSEGVALDELAVKRVAHTDGKFLTMLLKDEAELSQVANARADRKATEATDKDKLQKAVAKVAKLIEKGDIQKSDIVLQFRAVRNAVAKKYPDVFKQETMDIIKHYEASLKQGQKVKA